jgi:hypothetical protein
MSTSKSRFTVNCPEIQALTLNTYRCSPQTYFRISEETGECYVFAIRKAFIELGMSAKTASRLLRDCHIPTAEFIRNEPLLAPKGQLVSSTCRTAVEPEEPEAEPQAIADAALQAGAAREEKLAKKAEMEARANDRRWQLISTNSQKWGVWNNDGGRVIALYWTRQEADEELARLRAGSSQAGAYNYGSRRTRSPELEEVHY